VKINIQPHRNQLEDKMIKGKGTIWVSSTKGKNMREKCLKKTQNTKMNEHKKKPSKGVTLTCAHR
jgi:hypothetical protein